MSARTTSSAHERGGTDEDAVGERWPRWPRVVGLIVAVVLSFLLGTGVPGLFADRPAAVLHPAAPERMPARFADLGEGAIVREHGAFQGERLWTVRDEGVLCLYASGGGASAPENLRCERESELQLLLPISLVPGRVFARGAEGTGEAGSLPEWDRVLLVVRDDDAVEVWTGPAAGTWEHPFRWSETRILVDEETGETIRAD